MAKHKKSRAICIKCGNLTQCSQRSTQGKYFVVLGKTESYEPLCHPCYIKANAEDRKESGHSFLINPFILRD
jgi:thymidine kinase